MKVDIVVLHHPNKMNRCLSYRMFISALGWVKVKKSSLTLSSLDVTICLMRCHLGNQPSSLKMRPDKDETKLCHYTSSPQNEHMLSIHTAHTWPYDEWKHTSAACIIIAHKQMPKTSNQQNPVCRWRSYNCMEVPDLIFVKHTLSVAIWRNITDQGMTDRHPMIQMNWSMQIVHFYLRV